MKIQADSVAVRVGFGPVRPLWNPQATDSSLPRTLRLPRLPPLLGPYCPIHSWSDRQLPASFSPRAAFRYPSWGDKEGKNRWLQAVLDCGRGIQSITRRDRDSKPEGINRTCKLQILRCLDYRFQQESRAALPTIAHGFPDS
jgi:hypothetical protein